MIYEVNVYTAMVEVPKIGTFPEVETVYPDILQWEILDTNVEPLKEVVLWCDEAVLAELENDEDIYVITSEEAGAPWN